MLRRRVGFLIVVLLVAAPAAAQDVLGILHQTARDYPRAWQNAHREGSPERWDYIILACDRLYAASAGRIRCNWRRAVVGDLSMDGLSVRGADGLWRFVDVIGGAGGPNPSLSYREPEGDGPLLRNAAGQYVGELGAPTPEQIRRHHGWTHVDYSGGGGPADPPPPPGGGSSSVDLQSFLERLEAIRARLEELHAKVDGAREVVDRVDRTTDATQRQVMALELRPTSGCSRDNLAACPTYADPQGWIVLRPRR